jgi:cellulose synthase operon protein C
MSQKQKGKRQKVKGKTIPALSLFPFYFFLFTYLGTVPPLGNIAPVQAQKAPGAVQRGYALLKKGWVNDAIKAFQQALKAQPQSLPARLGLAIAYNRAGRIDDAWNAYQQVLAQDPNNQGALKIVGIMATYKPVWNVRGIEALTSLLRINSNDGEARSYRALLYSYQQRFGESVADYEILLANNPPPKVVLQAAEAYTYGGKYTQALELFNRYRNSGGAITGFQSVAYGRALHKTGNAAAAVKVLEAQLQRSKTLDRVAVETRKELAVAYLANKQDAQALGVLDPLQGRPDAVLPLARSLNEIRQRSNNPAIAQQVVTLYRQALAVPNPSPALLREAADVFTGLPQGQQTALQLYRQLALQQPNDQGILVRQLALENKLGLLTKSDLKQRLATLLQPLPSDRGQLQQIASALVNIDSPNPEFLSVYLSLLQSGVNTPFLNFRVAQMYVQQNDLNNARQALAAYSTTPDGAKDMASQLLAADIERREGSFDASAKRYEAVLKSKPETNDIADAALRGLAGVRLQQKRMDEAIAIYDQLITRNPQDLPTQLGRTSIAYQAKRISQPQAEAVLNNWLATQPATNTPPELFSLVGVLPAEKQREALYNYLIEVDPNFLPLQLRLVQLIAQRNPAQAQLRVKQIIARLPNSPNSYLIQGELARAIGDLNLASNAYENILAQQPDNIDALAALGGVRFEQRRFASAQNIYGQVLAQKPEDKDTRRALAGLSAVLDEPLTAMAQLEQLQVEQMNQGASDGEVSRQMQQIQEDFLQRRGFQPPWESYDRRGKN